MLSENLTPLRGLAAAHPDVRKKVSQIGGFVAVIRHGDEFAQQRAEKGGRATAEKYGRDYYVRIATERWRKQKMKRKRTTVSFTKESGSYRCSKCGKTRNTLRSLQRHDCKDK